MPTQLLVLQVCVIISVATIAGALARRAGQPAVVGEMAAGIILGLSVMGRYVPTLGQYLFPVESQPLLSAVSQLGLVLFLFLVGLELDLAKLRDSRRVAIAVSLGSTLFPFILGMLLSSPLRVRFAPAGISKTEFSLFIGIAMSITAFPVLARILAERTMLSTRVGATAVACAALDNVVGWITLAALLVVFPHTEDKRSLMLSTVGLLLYVGMLCCATRLAKLATGGPWQISLRRSTTQYLDVHNAHLKSPNAPATLPLTLVAILLCAWITDELGVHLFFGAFIAGLCFPFRMSSDDEVARRVHDAIEPLTSALLVPLFFVSTGLRTRIQLLQQPLAWRWTVVICVVAIIGKMGGAFVVAKGTRMGNREAAMLGALLNTRGLVELVILNIGLEIGVISDVLFAMMVFMALFTTVMTTPLVRLLRPREQGVVVNKRSTRIEVAVGRAG